MNNKKTNNKTRNIIKPNRFWRSQVFNSHVNIWVTGTEDNQRRNRNVTQARITGESSKGFCKPPTTSWSWDKWLPSNSSSMKLLSYFQNLSEMASTLLKKMKHVSSYGCFHSFTVRRRQFVINLTQLKSSFSLI